MVERSKLETNYKEAFPNDQADIGLVSDTFLLVQLLALDLKTKNLTYKQITIKYRVSMRTARTLKHRIVNTRPMGSLVGKRQS